MSTPKIDLYVIRERVGEADRMRMRAARHPGPIFDAAMARADRDSASDVPALLAHIAELEDDLKAWNDWFAEMTRVMNGNPA